MPSPTFLVSTWDDGLFALTGESVRHELPGQSVRGLASDGRGGVLAVVGNRTLFRRSTGGAWIPLITCEYPLSCCIALGTDIFVGTDDANILRIDANAVPHRLAGFDTVEGRATWYAGTTVIDGKVVGPPLGLRSITATCDGALLANVHVGGIPRSTDGGKSWRPTLDVAADAHQVRAHPTRPELVIAAAAVGLCISRDGGITWTVTHQGLHAPYCSGVAFGRNDILVSASADPFSTQGAVYRCPIDGDGPLQPLSNGMPRWTEGVVDTDCIAAHGAILALIDGAGWLYVSHNDGATWTQASARVPTAPSGLLIC